MPTYAFNAAAALYRKRKHPRLLLDANDVEQLRDTAKRGHGAKIMRALRQRVKLVVDDVAATTDLPAMFKGDGSHHSLVAKLSYAINDIAGVAAIDEDDATLDMLRMLFDATCAPGYQGRLGAINLAIAFDLIYDHLSESQRLAYAKTANKQVTAAIDRTKAHYFKGAGGNITLGTTLSAVPMILAVEGEAGARDFSKDLDYLITCFEATVNCAVAPTGYPEEDIGYGTHVTAWLVRMGEILRRAGRLDVYERCPRLKTFGHAVLPFVQPWGDNLSNTGDHGTDFGHREFPLARLAAETGDPALLWLLGTLYYHHGMVHPENTMPDFWVEVPLTKSVRTPASLESLLVVDQLTQGRRPTAKANPTAFHDPRRGLVSFRSGWNDDDALLVFDGSQRCPAAQGHFHASCGHVSLSSVGEYFSIDTGRYNNEQTCHSLVLVDGKPGRTNNGQWAQMTHHGNLTAYEPGAFVDSAAVDSSHQHDCYWARRHVGLVKGKHARPYVWVVDDFNKADDWAEYWWQLQTAPTNSITTRKTGATIKGFRHGNLLDVHFALPAASEYPKAHTLEVTQDTGEASAREYLGGDMRRSVARYKHLTDMITGPVYQRPRLLGKVAGYNGRFMSLLLPRVKGEAAAKVKRLPSLPASLAVSITFSDVEDTVIFAHEHQLLEAGDVVARGHWCVVRRSRKTGRVIDHAIAEGDRLEVAGKSLL